MTGVAFRKALKEDVSLILYFIKQLAEYERLSHEVVVTESSILEHMFGENPKAECILAEAEGKAVGFALFFHNFSTFLGKPGIYIEDIYVEPEYRGKGIGKEFFRELAKLALERSCGRLNWWVLDWNEPSINFYKSMGAVPQDEWIVYKLEGAALKKLAE